MLEVNMSKLYDRIVEIFEIGDLNIDKANRRTLLKYATRTKFQKRREVFYSVCKDGKKSKVAICKSDERPQWVHNLDTLKTKSLRNQLKSFLKELGAFVDPKKTNLERLAEEKNWHEVVFMDDESKSGGSGRAILQSGSRRPEPVASPSLRRSANRVPRPSIAPRDEISRADEKSEEKKDENKEASEATAIRALVQQLTLQLGSQGREIGHLFDINKNYASDLDRRAEKKADRHDDRLKEITNLLKERPVDRPIEIPKMAGGGDAEQLFRDSGIRVIERDGNKCVFLDEEEECVCKPKKWRHSEFNQESRDTLKSLAENKAISCAKIDLLRCLSVEFRTQVKTWKRFNENCEGDYLANISPNHIRELLCKKQPVFSGIDLHVMKSVANAYDLSQNLCKGHRDSMARFNDKDAIGKDYTLGHMCYDSVHDNVRKYNDEWSKAAFRNRKPDPRPTMTLICEKPDGPPEAVQIEMNPPPKAETTTVLPSGAVGFPSAGGQISVGGGGAPTFYPQIRRPGPPPPPRPPGVQQPRVPLLSGAAPAATPAAAPPSHPAPRHR